MTNPSASEARTIAVVLKGYPRLSETFIAQELLGLERQGFRLRLYAMRHPTDKKRHPINDEIQAPVAYLPEYIHDEPLRVARAVRHVAKKPGFAQARAAWLRDLRRDPTRNRVRRFGQACVLAAELPPDVSRLYAHFIHTPSAVTRYASLITGLPWSASAHAKDIWTSPDWDLAGSLGSADWVATCTAVGAAHLREIAETVGRGKHVHLIYHGLDLARFPEPDVALTINARDGSSAAQAVRLLSVGRAVPKKGFDDLLVALSKLPTALHWHWTHIGGGDGLGPLKSAADALGLTDRITWSGALAQTEVLAAYRSSDLFVLPCRIGDDGDRDGLPNVLVEAQSQNLACLSTRVSAIPELIIDGETGVLVESRDPDALATALGDLVTNPERRQTLGRAGRARVRSAFDMHGGLAQLTALFPHEFRFATSPIADAAE